MFKVVCLLKRRPGMSFEDFVDHYESHHVRFGERVLPEGVRYIRRYLRPFPDPDTGEAAELDYDVLTELWCESRAVFDAAIAALAEPGIAAEIAEDEAKLFDRSRTRFCTVEEYESVRK